MRILGFDTKTITQKVGTFSLRLLILTEDRLAKLVDRLREIEPDISKQYSYQKEFNDYWELKLRLQHAFQCSLMLKALESLRSGKLTLVDIGDSAGTHMRYIKELMKDKSLIDTISVNLDSVAVEKIKSRGQNAILCRAEELDLKDKEIDLFTSFQTVEHLHSPTLFFRRLAKKSRCNRLVVTVPYARKSRVGLDYIRNRSKASIFSESVHIFELSPSDWTLLMLYSGWKVVYSEVYCQYPRKFSLLNQLLAFYWRETDFEGFWGAILEKDTTLSDCYQNWED